MTMRKAAHHWWLVVIWLCWGAGLMVGCGSEGSTCKASEECGVGFYCRTDGVCKAGCRLSIECPAGQVCRTNQCLNVQKDEDQDGFPVPLDCDDTDRLINGAAQEICANDKDDNCDGNIDEEGCVKVDCRPGESRDCYDGKESTLTFPGTRCRKGRQVCGSTGVWGDCQGQVLPSPEICDNQDNDCNGKVDDGEGGKALSRSCFSGKPENRGRGICKDGQELCEKGAWGDCKGEVKASDESCDGTDGDCNGQIDDVKGVNEACDSGLKGPCQAGRQICDPKQKKLICEAQVKPSDKEICDNKIDDDCDGQVDQDCPYTPLKVADVRSFPHYVALSDKYAAISLRDTKKVVFFDLSGGAPKQLREVTLPDAPHGIQIDAANGNAYATTDSVLYEIPIASGGAQTAASFAKASHAASLLLSNGRAFTRRVDATAQGELMELCKTELATKQSDCVALQGPLKKAGLGLVFSGVFAIMTADVGLLFVDTVGLKEEKSKEIKVTDGVEDIAIDDKTKLAVVTSPASQSIHIVDLSASKVTKTIPLSDGKGGSQTPGRIVAADGRAYVGHRDGNVISIIDLDKGIVDRRLEVCLAPLGMAISGKSAKGGRTLWITCPGDNTIWQMPTEP